MAARRNNQAPINSQVDKCFHLNGGVRAGSSNAKTKAKDPNVKNAPDAIISPQVEEYLKAFKEGLARSKIGI